MTRTQKLTPKQARFVAEYLVDLNATQAAIRAGYSRKTADSIGLQLLRKTQVASAIQKAQEDRARRVEITQDEIIRDIMEVRDRCMQRAPVGHEGEAGTGRSGQQPVGLQLSGCPEGLGTARETQRHVRGPVEGGAGGRAGCASEL